MKKIIVAAIISSVSGVAFAADNVSADPVPVYESSAAYDWTGAYAGVGVGGSFLENKISVPGLPGLNAKKSLNGVIANGFAGYNYQMDSIVVGVEGDLSYNWNKTTLRKWGGKVDMGSDVGGSLRARLGYSMDNVLIYGTGGWSATNGYVEARGREKSKVFHGWTLGAGMDYAVTSNMFVRAEYRFTDYQAKNVGLKFDPHQHQATIGVGFKF